MATDDNAGVTPSITGNLSDQQSGAPSAGDPSNSTPFYGENTLTDNVIDFPVSPVSQMPAQAVNPFIGSPGKNITGSQKNISNFISNYTQGKLQEFDATEGKNNYAKIFSYDSGPDSNAFYDRYAAFGEEKFSEVGFSPIRDNEANFNANTTWWDNTSRMLKHSFFPLATLGFKSGVNSLGKMLQGDFTSADLEEAKDYEYYAALGQDSRGGGGAFFNNTFMNFGYTAGIIVEAIGEEFILAAANTMTGGSLLGVQAARTASIANRLGKASKLFQIPKAFKSTLSSMNNVNKSRNFWKAVNSPAGRFINPLENTFDAIKGIKKGLKQGENISALAKGSKTFVNFYRDVRNVNMALAEARLEGGMVENHIYDTKYREFYKEQGRAPTNEEQRFIRTEAKKGTLETVITNAGLIYLSNKIVFRNIVRPRGGMRNFMKNVQEEVMEVGQGSKFGSFGKILYDNAAKKFAFQANTIKGLAKSWWKNPGFKTLGKTVGYFKANVTEGLQENFQESIARANEAHYLESFNSEVVKAAAYGKSINGLGYKENSGAFGLNVSLANYKKELAKEVSTQGATTFFSGFLMGTFAGPLNGAMPFLSTQYNRIFDKKAYASWIKDKTRIQTSLIKELNEVDLNTFINNRAVNLGTQDIISKRHAGYNTSTKEVFDADNESFIAQSKLMRESGTKDLFINNLKAMNEFTDEELAKELPSSDVKDVPAYRAKINNAISKIETIDKRFEEAEELFPNPVNLNNIDRTNGFEGNSQAALYHAWETSKSNYVFMSESFADVTKRMSTIQETYMQKNNIGNVDYNAAKVLFTPDFIREQSDILEQEIDTEQQKKNPNANRISALKDQNKYLNEFKSSFDAFNKLYNKEDFIEEAKNAIKAETEKDATVEEIDQYLEQQSGSLSEESQNKIIKNLRSAHDNYLKSIAKGVNTTIFDETLNDGFNKLLDFYKLGKEGRALSAGINILHDPAGFLDLVNKNQEWIRRLYDKRSEYYTDLVKDQMNKVADNALLNVLANQQLYVSAEDFANFIKDGTPPLEIYDDKNKVVYKKGTQLYDAIYKETFAKSLELKDNDLDTEIMYADKVYQQKLDQLNELYDTKINNLPKEETKYVIASFPIDKNKTYTLKDLSSNLKPNQYLSVVHDAKEDATIFFMDEENNLKFVDESGQIVDISKIDKEFKFINGEIYDIRQMPNQDLVTEINKERTEAKDLLEKEYLANKDKEESEAAPVDTDIKKDTIYSTNTDLADIPADLRNSLFLEFDKTLSSEDRDTLTDEQQDNLFDKFIKSGSPIVKKIIDDYNKKQSTKKSAGITAEDFEFKFGGKTISTKGKNTPTLRALQNQLNVSIQNLEDKPRLTEQEKKNLKYYKIQVKNLDQIIKDRIKSGFTPKQLEAIEKIQELKAKQPKYRQEDDGYYIDGIKDPLTRVTTAIARFLGLYQYTNKDKVIEIFDRTLGKDSNALDAFIDEIANANLSGVEPYTLRELKARLPKALEKQESKETTKETSVKDSVINLVGELTYESSRITGNYVDQAVKDLFDKGTVPEFNENQITKEAYDNLFGENGYLTELKTRVDNGELYIASTGIVVYDTELNIAGEIDLLVADRNGNITIVDIKTGEANKWKGFSKKNNKFSKLKAYGLQQTAYANLLQRMIGVDAKIALLPIEITKSTNENTDGKIETAKKPSAINLLTTEYLISLNKEDFIDEINTIIPVIKTEKPISIDNSSSEEQENPSIKTEFDFLKMSKSEQESYNEIIKDLENAKDEITLDTVETKIMMFQFNSLLPAEAFQDLNEELEVKRLILKGTLFNGVEILSTLEIDKEFVASTRITKEKGKNKGDVFAEQYAVVKISKIDKDKITLKSEDGSTMTISLENLNLNYMSVNSINNPNYNTKNKIGKEAENFGNETTTTSSTFLSDTAGIESINASNITEEKSLDDLLNDTDC
tara:strand:- start:992 stop:6817 length:5826 start_codon:yes stop_codon:yes gene_type:complete